MFSRSLIGVCTLNALALGLIISTASEADATSSGSDLNCALLDSTQGGSATALDPDEQRGLSMFDGEVISFGAGTFEVILPGSFSSQTLSGPGTLAATTANEGNWSIRRNSNATISCGVAAPPPPPTANTESDNLDQQQAALSSLLMLHHANTMRMGVEENVDGALGSGPGVNAFTANGFAFSTRNAAGQRSLDGLTAYVDGGKNPGVYEHSVWNAWLRGRFSGYDGDANTFDGYIADIFGGVDYKVAPNILIGALAGYGRTDFDTNVNGTLGGFEADGLTIGGYTGIQLAPALTFNAMIAYTGSEYDNRSGATSGSFDADRITIAAHLRGRRDYGAYTLAPSLEFLWASESQDGYVDSAAVAHSALTVSAGRISMGPRLYFPEVETVNGTFRLWAGAMGEYEFSNRGPVPASGLPDLESVGSARLSGGFDGQLGAGALSLRGDVFGIGSSEYIGYGGSASFAIPF